MTTQARLTPRSWAMMGLMALIWAGSFTANHAALTALPVPWVVAIRATGGALTLWGMILWGRLPVPRTAAFLRTSIFLGIFNIALPFGLIVWGQSHVPSGLAGILNSGTALFTVLLAALVFPDERLTVNKLLGVLLGLCGVAVILGPDTLTHFDPTSLGQLAILGAGLSYAVSGVYGRKRLSGIRPEVSAAAMLTVAAAITLPTALVTTGLPALPPPPILGALAYLAVLSSALAYKFYYAVMIQAGAGNIGLVTLLIAPVAVLLGWAFFGESLPHTAFAGLALLTLGMILVDGRLTRRLFR